MRRILLATLAALTVLLAAAGGVTAMDLGDTTELTDDPDPAGEPIAENDSADDDEAEVGICVVGVDSPCNGENASAGAEIGDNSSEDGEMWIPEDQDRDGEIDDRFEGDDNSTEMGICAIGVDSPCNGDRAENPIGDTGDTGSVSGIVSPGVDDDSPIPGEAELSAMLAEQFPVVSTVLSTLLGLR